MQRMKDTHQKNGHLQEDHNQRNMPRQKKDSNKDSVTQKLEQAVRHKPIEELNIIDDFLFGELMGFKIGRDRIKYTFENICTEELDLKLDDGATRIFLNTRGSRSGTDELKDLLTYVEKSKESNAINDELKKVHKMLKVVKTNKKVRNKYMLAIEHDMEVRAEGMEKGMNIISLYLRKYSIEDISDILHIEKDLVEGITMSFEQTNV